MSNKEILQELKELRAQALGFAEQATRLISRMEVVSTPSLSKKGKGLTDKQKAEYRKSLYKTALK